MEPAGRGEGVIAPPPPRPSPAPSLSPPPDSGLGTRTSEARGGRTGRARPGRRRRRSEHTHALTQAVKSIQAPRPAPSTAAAARRAPPSGLPTLRRQLQSCGTGRGGEEAAAVAGSPRLASPLSGPSGSRGQRPELRRQKGQKQAAPAPRRGAWASFRGRASGPLPPPLHKRRGSESLVRGGAGLGARLGHSPGGCHAPPPTIRCLGRLNLEPPPTFRWESAQIGGGGCSVPRPHPGTPRPPRPRSLVEGRAAA